MNVAKSDLKKWAREKFKGPENCTLPSFSPDLSELDEEGIRWDVHQAIRHGFFSTLCTCEAGMTPDEVKRFVEIVADEAKGKILVSITLMCDSFKKSRELLAHAEKVGCSHVLFGYPANFYPKTSEEIFQVTKELCDSTNLGIVLYPTPHFNFERLHPSAFPLEVLNRAAEFDNVVAIKLGEAGLIAECWRKFGDQVLLSCPIERWWPMLYLAYKQQWIGAGPYETMQSPDKPYLVQYGKLMMEGKMDEAMEIFWNINTARLIFEQEHMKVVMLGVYPWTLYKYYQWLVGGNGGLTRQPSIKIHQHQMELARMALRFIGITPNELDEEFYVGKFNYARMSKK